MTTIYLYGEMAEKFGGVWNLAVSSVGEMVRAIEANKPGFVAYLEESGQRGVDFNVKVNEADVQADASNTASLTARRTIETIKISPVVRGSKDPWVSVVIGAVLIIAAVTIPGMQNLAFGIKGITWAAVIGGMGLSMAIGGVAQMIAGTPKVNGAIDQDGGQQNPIFNGPENTTTQGGAMPLIYGGPMLVGSRVVSAGIYTEDTGNGGPFINVTDPYGEYDESTGGVSTLP